MCFSALSPNVPPVPKAPAAPPQQVSQESEQARQRNRIQATLAQGRQSNILTTGLGLTTPAPTVPKSVLGQ